MASPQCDFLFPPDPGTGHVRGRLRLALSSRRLVAIVTKNVLMVFDEQSTLPGV